MRTFFQIVLFMLYYYKTIRMSLTERYVRLFIITIFIYFFSLKERLYPKLPDVSRKKRVAAGAGVQVSDINILLERFEQSQQFVKMVTKMGKNRFF